MDRLLGHRQTKGAATDNAEPNATAPHLDSTDSRPSILSISGDLNDRFRREQTFITVCKIQDRPYCYWALCVE
jgi:hypothetical protein